MTMLDAAARGLCRIAALAGVLFSVMGTTRAASFDCARARSDHERLICTDAALGVRDEILSTVYAAALRKDASGRIRSAQREWLAGVSACGTVACLAEAYDRRIGVLLATEGGNATAAHFYTEAPEGNRGTLDIVGPVRGFAAISLTSTFVGPAGADAGDVNVGSIRAVLDLRGGSAATRDKGCIVAFQRWGADRWEVEQRGTCDLPRGVVFAGTYRR